MQNPTILVVVSVIWVALWSSETVWPRRSGGRPSHDQDARQNSRRRPVRVNSKAGAAVYTDEHRSYEGCQTTRPGAFGQGECPWPSAYQWG